jgi:carbamate kinase
VGEVYDEEQARQLAESRGWTVKQDVEGWRRVVGSPTPQRVVETRLIRLLLQSGAVVVCAGGGGVPVVRNEDGRLEGVEAVVDKDLTSSVLAEALEADVFLVLTDVPHVERGFGTPQAEPILRATPAALRREEFAAGSMGPKVDAVSRFVEVTGDLAAIGRLEDAVGILEGRAGTIVTPSGEYGGLHDLRPSAPGA